MSVSNHQRNLCGADGANGFFERGDVHVAFEGRDELRLARFGAGKIERLGADEFAIRARGIEVRVVRHDVARFAHHAEQKFFRRRGPGASESRA